ncbi:hypothetical protein G3I15_39410, partial [Streptomyces sp. SID10244]|nr:hypothetical protein [Streptomyces sp. SID10244]
LVQGKCYQIPLGGMPSASLSDYKELACGATKAAGTEIVRVDQRSNGQPSCSSDQLSVYFALPKPLGYCLAEPT